MLEFIEITKPFGEYDKILQPVCCGNVNLVVDVLRKKRENMAGSKEASRHNLSSFSALFTVWNCHAK